jgi:hypothetical protein
MSKYRLVATVLSAGLLCLMMAAQSHGQTRTQARTATPAGPGKCLLAANGKCTNPAMVEAVRQRAIVLSSIRVSYYGTPAGTVGSRNIPLERFFQDDPVVFGLPTNIYVTCCVTRSK